MTLKNASVPGWFEKRVRRGILSLQGAEECRAYDKSRQAPGKAREIKERHEGVRRERKERFGQRLPLGIPRGGIRKLFVSWRVRQARIDQRPQWEQHILISRQARTRRGLGARIWGGRRRGGRERERKGDGLRVVIRGWGGQTGQRQPPWVCLRLRFVRPIVRRQ